MKSRRIALSPIAGLWLVWWLTAPPTGGLRGAEQVETDVPEVVTPFADRLRPMNRILDQMDEGWSVWGCAPIYGPDDRVHVFFARWRHGPRKTEITWTQTGQIAHAVAKRPEGPYEFKGVVLQGRGAGCWDGSGVINPQIYAIDGKYALLYTGARNGEKQGQQIGMAVAASLDGPWRNVSDKRPLLAISKERSDFDSYLVNNPALIKTPQGKYFLYYKGRDVFNDPKGKRKIGLAIADRLHGPYRKYAGNPIIDMSRVGKDFEDPYVWMEDGRFCMLMHDMGVFEHGAGLYLESFDGIHWSKPVAGYPSTLTLFGVKQRLETPILLLRDGRPDYLFNNRAGSKGDLVFSGFVFKVLPKDTSAEAPDKTATGDKP